MSDQQHQQETAEPKVSVQKKARAVKSTADRVRAAQDALAALKAKQLSEQRDRAVKVVEAMSMRQEGSPTSDLDAQLAYWEQRLGLTA